MKDSEIILKNKHFQLLSFLITSASGCVNEPQLYGPLRLLDAALRVIEIMENEETIIPELIQLKEKINHCIDILMYDENEFIKMLNEINADLGKIIKNINKNI